MENNRKILTIGIITLLLSCFYFYDVKAVSIYDGYSCVNGVLRKDSDGTTYGKCVSSSGGRFEACPTQAQMDKYSMNKIYASMEFEYDSTKNKYNLVLHNLKGLYIKFAYGGANVPNSENIYPDSNGNLRLTELALDMQFKVILYLDSTNSGCSNTQLGTITDTTPSYRTNVLYNDSLCVQYRSKFANKASLAQSLVPECYEKNLQVQYNRDDVKKRVDDATTTIINLSSSSISSNINLKCDFYGENNTGRGKSTSHTYSVNKYWDVVCFETLKVDFDTPKALYAGDSFEYWVDLEVEKVCYPKRTSYWPDDPCEGVPLCPCDPDDDPGGDNPGGDNPGGDNPGGNNPGGNNPGDKDKGPTYPPSCEFKTVCWTPTKTGVYEWSPHSGPNDSFDSCVKSCDGGEYTQDCINKCYNTIYGKGTNSSTTSNSKLYSKSSSGVRRLLGATRTSEGASSSSNIPIIPLQWEGKVYYITDGVNGWDGLECDEFQTVPSGCYSNYPHNKTEAQAYRLPDSSCSNDHDKDTVYNGVYPGWFTETKYCKGPNSKMYSTFAVNCNSQCYEMVKDESCLAGTNILNGSSSNGSTGGSGTGVTGGVFSTSGSSSSSNRGSSSSSNTCSKEESELRNKCKNAKCSGKGNRVLDEIEESLNEVYARLDKGDFSEYEDDNTKFEGKIIDSLTNESTTYTDTNGNPLTVEKSVESVTYTVDTENPIKVKYEWSCPTCAECPKREHGGGSGGSGGGGGSSCGPPCYGGPGFASSTDSDISASQMATRVRKDSEECDEYYSDDADLDCSCGKDYEDYEESRTFTNRQYKTVVKYTIILGRTYKSALDGGTIYGEGVYNKLPSSTKSQYFYAGYRYYSNLFSPVINDWRKWPTYGPNNTKPNCLNDKSCIDSRDSSIKHNIIEYFVVGSWGQWKVNIECFYGIINNYCPDCPDIDQEERVPCDPSKEVCTGLQYKFRPIDINNKNMFPERNPRWNWTGTISTNLATGSTSVTGASVNDRNYKVDPQKLINSIQNKGNGIYSSSDEPTGQDRNPELDYEIVLSQNNIRTIKNDIKYDLWTTCTNGKCVKNQFDMNCSNTTGNRVVCTSKFLRNSKYLQLVKKPTQNGCNNLYNGRCIDSGSR